MKLSLNITLPIFATILLFVFCNHVEPKTTKSIEVAQKHPKFNEYWYQGKAEITSYKLTQSRYGELYEGTAVNIFVTEDFLPDKQVKADNRNDKNIPILKLNSTKKFITGIYPYSLMTSTFSPINTNEKAIKISFSAQEWCGNTFVQLNNREQFKIDFHSYFESNADRKISLDKNILEDELWNILRINPKSLPIGKLTIIPSFEFLALNHQKIKAYKATTSLVEKDNFIIYAIHYPKLERTLVIKATKEFPFIIESWEETSTRNGKTLTTKAQKIKTIKSAYWNKNSASDTKERKELGL
ncbi:septum formation inhibitor Maf [Polaribacter batillariae]|uniref:Septum formation inhibitor Maf n=1 Tax=Polaribacter batillariae TaxID=2808900 RepID=A0ABX7SZD4_9FLAO|nr:septum formation inhibitor Maf [Polaribacter batillariae]QTD38371.1 septum formation inhibitor Maf [Polaribacter batillariae]